MIVESTSCRFLGSRILVALAALFLLFGLQAKSQVYSHNFGTTAITAHPYNVAPQTLNANLSGSSWTNSAGVWTSGAGSTGQAIRIQTATAATITLTIQVAPNYLLNITSFNFWTQRSNTGPTAWTLSANGINMGSGATSAGGAAIGNTNVANAVSGLTGTVTIQMQLTPGTGNGTLRLDDFTLNGSVVPNCSGSTVTGVLPINGPANTLVNISGTGFQTGSGTSAVTFNGVPATFTVISSTLVQAYVPANSGTGIVAVTTNACPSISAVNFSQIVSVAPPIFSSDLFISEIYDAQAGDTGVIELYNGTANTINLNGYTIRRYGDIGDTAYGEIFLTGSVASGQIYMIGIGTGTTPCSVTGNMDYTVGYNANDEFELYNGTTLIDNVWAPNEVGYSIVRKPNAIAPKAVFDANDWVTSSTETCADIGQFNAPTGVIPPITSPVSIVTCENGSATFSASVPNPASYTFQWKMLNTAGVWVNVPNAAPYSGANSGTLTINPVPAGFPTNQFYCQMTMGTNIVSNAAQMTVNTSTIPDFDMTPLTYCQGATPAVLATTSPNGVVGTWNPSVINTSTVGTQNHIFTPNAGQCAVPRTLSVTVTNSITPNFANSAIICQGLAAPTLATTSPNGITGTWNPSVASNTVSGSYVFTPDAGQCAVPVTMTVTITNSVTPNFATTLVLCQGSVAPILATTSPNGISGTWNPSTINNTTSGNYVFTPNAGQCAVPMTLNVSVTNSITPNFATTLVLCQGSVAPILATTSPNGISGTWNPSTINNTTSGSYVFTPNPGQCAVPVTLNVSVTNSITPNFATTLVLCQGSVAPILATTSPNGISGTWNPSTINNTASGSYVFTPNAGQCAVPVTLNVSVTNSITPNFATTLVLCQGSVAPILATTSPNGIVGTWNPSTINNTTSGSYVFTPNPGQCAVPVTLNVSVTNSITPNFANSAIICQGLAAPTLATTSPNGITGTWNPSVVSNTLSGSYVFTPDAGQCAVPVTMAVTITNSVTPNFATTLALCQGSVAPILATTSPNGIVGTWNPSTINNTTSGNYVFTPNVGQCAVPMTLNVSVTNSITPNFATTLVLCQGSVAPILAATSPNGISGTWNPSTINNTTSGSYVFTPNPGQCAVPVTLNVSVTNSITPNFATTLALCQGSVAPVLAATSPNGISGTWNPSIINSTTSGSYIFTPNPGQCAVPVTLNVSVTNSITPNFATTLVLCQGSVAPVLATTSPNGISGTWSPSTINNTTSGTYVFTPNANQCAVAATLSVTITPSVAPDFATILALCQGDVAPILATTSPNGISGTWNPSIINNTTSGSYVFTPNAGQCATVVTLNVTVNPLPNPVLTDGFICVQNGVPSTSYLLNTGLSNSGYSFVWTNNGQPLATISNSHLATEAGNYLVVATNLATGCVNSASATVTAVGAITVTADTPRDFADVTNVVVNVSGGSGNYSYLLDGEQLQTTNVFYNVSAGDHTIEVRDENGCGVETITFFFLDYPHYFTPNGDGFHDYWNINGLSGQAESKISIFDRYGKLIKQIKPSDTSGWDGTYNGHPLPSTDYWFVLEYVDRNLKLKEFRAHFALKR
ncbi:T9SS type B sorting domain-containing protein [Flavobacterium sp.]|uniref:T9SS type B sorting domain-containing protein n=1 Tax=Flavobacterium sp. TaxID=239 RepID=UPI001225E3EB|nr:T9SS type B sorting domain-containing protein [Flavobacterium sp.]RZJ70400.1 MAG: T9SS type B sorting domain-containing protein [Flavobacterium sp.]